MTSSPSNKQTDDSNGKAVSNGMAVSNGTAVEMEIEAEVLGKQNSMTSIHKIFSNAKISHIICAYAF